MAALTDPQAQAKDLVVSELELDLLRSATVLSYYRYNYRQLMSIATIRICTGGLHVGFIPTVFCICLRQYNIITQHI